MSIFFSKMATGISSSRLLKKPGYGLPEVNGRVKQGHGLTSDEIPGESADREKII
jgi:hypothetical protein